MNTLTDRQKEQLRIAVAEIAGWTEIVIYNGEKSCGTICGTPPSGAARCQIPDYLNDLNAVHELESMLGPEWDNSWQAWLFRVIVGTPPKDYLKVKITVPMMRASALQRCIAIVRTVAPEKWEEIEKNP